MQGMASTRIIRSAAQVLFAGAAVGAVVGLGAWHLLPYEALQAHTAAQRYGLWEGVMWALGLAGTLFGLAALLNATDLSGANTVEHVHQLAQDARRGRTLYSDLPALPWLLLACGLALIAVALAGRAIVHG